MSTATESKRGATQTSMYPATVTYSYRTWLTPLDATLSRVQRALAFKQRQQPHSAVERSIKGCKFERPFEPRRSSLFPFEGSVIFLAIHVVEQRDDTGTVTGIDVFAARLDTTKLERMPPGDGGSFFIDEIKKESRHICSKRGGNYGWLRRRVAQLFEDVYCSDVRGPLRNIVLIGYNKNALLASLSNIGFDPKMQ